ncbi:MAG: tetratricopeptide repeat protein [Lutibacter sp.]
MKQLLLVISLLYVSVSLSQENAVAYQYFSNGNYQKAAEIYKELHEQSPYNSSYVNYLIDCYLRLEQFENVEKVVNQQLQQFPNQKYLYVPLGYSYQLQGIENKANNFYQKAIDLIPSHPSFAYMIGYSFQNYALFKQALKAFQLGMTYNKNANYNFQIATIYGEQGEIEKMFNSYLNLIDLNKNYLITVKNYLGRFISSDKEDKYNLLLNKILLKKLQENPDNQFNKLLSWLYVQQQEYFKAFIQYKALFKRQAINLSEIENLGKISLNNSDYDAAKRSFNFVIDNAINNNTLLNAKLYLIQIALKTQEPNATIESKFNSFFNEFGKNHETLQAQIIYAQFLAYQKKDSKKAIQLLKESLSIAKNEFERGNIKIKLGDIYVFNNQFNTALIYFTQVKLGLKNNNLGQLAMFKIAQTSYFKGDFNWAQNQLKILKNATSQLIANDALKLSLLITDNDVKDTLHIALKTYAKADLYAHQKQYKTAIDTLQKILINFKGHPIEDEALFKQAELYKKTNQLLLAESDYLKIIALNNQNILIDDALFNLAELYRKQLNLPEKAKAYYKKIIFEYPSSIYLVNARKQYRKLRGDTLN